MYIRLASWKLQSHSVYDNLCNALSVPRSMSGARHKMNNRTMIAMILIIEYTKWTTRQAVRQMLCKMSKMFSSSHVQAKFKFNFLFWLFSRQTVLTSHCGTIKQEFGFTEPLCSCTADLTLWQLWQHRQHLMDPDVFKVHSIVTWLKKGRDIPPRQGSNNVRGKRTTQPGSPRLLCQWILRIVRQKLFQDKPQTGEKTNSCQWWSAKAVRCSRPTMPNRWRGRNLVH